MSKKVRDLAYVAFLLAIVALVWLASQASFPVVQATEDIAPYNAGSSDCIANQATGDFYPRGQNSSHCELGDQGAIKSVVHRVAVRTSAPTTRTVAVLSEDSVSSDDYTLVTTPDVVIVVTPIVVIAPPVIVTPPAPTCNGGNPGNLKCNGNAGEDPNGKGTMDNDNAGGNGNGEHGNQGQGGNGNDNQGGDNGNQGGNGQGNGQDNNNGKGKDK
jgi:hypothetical protein